MSTKNNTALKVIANTAGRFFGLQTRSESINAQLVNFGPALISVRDRNTGRYRNIAKSQVKAVTFQGRTYSTR
jgi:hypothetical protein